MAQEEYRFDEEPGKEKSKLGGIGKFLWNSETKEFCGRDGSSWAKVSLFYAIFYTCLGAFFVGMLSVFMVIMPVDRPTYYGPDSAMASRIVLNPGLGFRPQIDVEDSLIKFNPNIYDNVAKNGYKTYVDSMKDFLGRYYKPVEDQDTVYKTCSDDEKYDLTKKSCPFDHEKIFEATNCTAAKSFGFNSRTPCVMLKLNKIISWEPEFAKGEKKIKIQCVGETSVDRDSIKEIVYHSENRLNNKEAAYIDAKYFPYYNQKSYRSPFVFVQVVTDSNSLVNVECKAYADNIDNSDRTNRRGMTKFSLFVATNSN